VLSYLDRIDPEAAQRARARYACFDHFGKDEQAYGYATGLGIAESCEEEVVSQLVDMHRRAAEYARRFDLVLTEPLGFNNTFAILVRDEDARKLNLKTISDAAKISGNWRAGFGQDFMSRADGYPGFARTYGFHFNEIREMDLSLTYRALAEKQVDLIAGNSTDGLISRYGLTQLIDDLNFFPPYDAVPVARRDTLTKYPEIRAVLKKLGGVLTVEQMRKLNYAVDGEKRPPKDVAREFLLSKQLLSRSDPAP